MSKFYVVSYTQAEIIAGKGLQASDIYSNLIFNVDLVRNENGNVLVYAISEHDVDEKFKEKYGDFWEYEFIKHSALPYIQKSIDLRIRGEIEESEIPKNAAILLKF